MDAEMALRRGPTSLVKSRDAEPTSTRRGGEVPPPPIAPEPTPWLSAPRDVPPVKAFWVSALSMLRGELLGNVAMAASRRADGTWT
jgi:hypothetical protein